MKTSYVQTLIDQAGTPEKAITKLVAESKTHPVDARLNLQVLLNVLGREEESFRVSQELIAIAPEDHRVLFNHGWHWLKRGELQKGMALLEFGRPLNTYGHPPISTSRPLWTPEKGRHQSVILSLEGGFGDEIIHVRFGQYLAEQYHCKVILTCHPALAPTFARIPWISAVAQREAAPGIYHESWLPGMSAALALGFNYTDLSGKPYLTPSSSFIEKWKLILKSTNPKKLKVGIRWAGNPEFEHQQYRIFPEEILFGLQEFQGTQLFSFQKDQPLKNLPSDIINLEHHLETWEDTAAALSEMDLVISSCTSVAHLSAALGKPTWVIVPALPYFIWAHPGNDSPWYESVTLFRQGIFGKWDDVRDSLRFQFYEWVKTQTLKPILK